ncbi:hypothetical protein C8R44DRAFT_177044 [Mycena epipterygia]|nr:hypothetical protein C8R44DRAFT_177044 [Mycena epipterygia]
MSGASPLNPGPPARKRSPLCKFSVWVPGVVLANLFLAVIIFGSGKPIFQITQFSHSRVFQNQTLEEVKNRATVVRPLIDGHQSFDIAVSIWTLPATEYGAESVEDVVETPLYSDIVFRGLRLSDKYKHAVLTYNLPVAVFRRLLLKQNDLRASFVAIPTSPSLIDHVTNFSTWRPENMKIPPVRSWPFPLGTSSNAPRHVGDRALDSFGISIPLLEFYEIHSKCANGSDSEIPKLSSQQVEDEGNDAEEGDENEAVGNSVEVPGVSDIAKFPQHAVKRHPFVVTRTQIRVIDETHIFNRKAYNKEHDKLRTTSCGQGLPHTVPDHNLCRRSYLTNGHWETRLELQIPDENTGELRTEWAYAPYIGRATSSSGPKDIIPVPVTRENCTQSDNVTSNDPEFVEVNWKLSYSGPTPPEFVLFQQVKAQRIGHLKSDYKKAEAHDTAELKNGLYGQRFHLDAHPRRYSAIDFLSSILSLPLAVLDMGYWYTRTSTVSISLSGTVLIALSVIISALSKIANSAETLKLNNLTSQWTQWLWLTIVNLIFNFSLPWFMLKAVTRLEFSRKKSSWFPSVRRVAPSYKERNSQRLDSRTTWGVKACMCISLIAIYYLFSPDEYHIVSAHLLAPDPSDNPTNSVSRVAALVFFPLALTGELSQLLLNQRTTTFAGSYKIAVVFRSILVVPQMVQFLLAVIGRLDARPGFSALDALSAPDVGSMIMFTVTLWQVFAFPNAVQTVED